MLNQKLIPMLLGTTHMATDMPYLITAMVITSSERDLLMLNLRANHTTVMVVCMVDTVTATVDTTTENKSTAPNYVYIQLLKKLVEEPVGFLTSSFSIRVQLPFLFEN